MKALTMPTAIDWEPKFARWASPPGVTEETRIENAIRGVRNAVAASPKLNHRSIKVFVQGSYRNNVNVRGESDVDIGVMCYESFFKYYPPGKTDSDFGNVDATYSYRQFKDELEEALVSYFGRSAVHRGNKAFDIHANTYHVDADVVPLNEYRHYSEDGSYLCGVALLPDNGGRITNYPEILLPAWPRINQHYENGVAKNEATQRRFKSVVRILKVIRNEMDAAGITAAKAIPGYFVECLVWNAPDSTFGGGSWDERVQAVLLHLWSNTQRDDTCNEWTEVDDIKYLFRYGQPWNREQAHAFIDAAWAYVGDVLLRERPETRRDGPQST